MPVLKRNHRQILAAQPIGGKRTRFAIEGVRGLLLEVSSAGKKTWYVRYQIGSGTARTIRFYRIGEATAIGVGAAIARAREVMARVDIEGADVFVEERTPNVADGTFGSLFDRWYERHALPRLARPEDEQRLYRLYVQPVFGARALSTIRRCDVRDHRDHVAEHCGPIASNHMVTLFNRVMNWAVEEAYIEFNPAHRLRKIGDARPRERVLSEDELGKLWRALDRMERLSAHHTSDEPGRMLTPGTRAALRIMMLTGQRRIEVAGTYKSELELDCDLPMWTIPGKRTKNRLLHRVPLTRWAAAEFGKAVQAARRSSIFVLPSARADEQGHLRPDAITKGMQRTCHELGINGAGPHDLRRTVGTELARLGVPVHVRALILNHSRQSASITDNVYNRYAYDAEKREALELWERRLQQIVA